MKQHHGNAADAGCIQFYIKNFCNCKKTQIYAAKQTQQANQPLKGARPQRLVQIPDQIVRILQPDAGADEAFAGPCADAAFLFVRSFLPA